jgi:hypothetical protein
MKGHLNIIKLWRDSIIFIKEHLNVKKRRRRRRRGAPGQ